MRFNLSLALLPLLIAGCAADRASTPAAPKLFTQGYGAKPGMAPTLYVVVHGDGVRTAINTDGFARTLAATEPGSAVVRLLRPGYSDGAGGQSPGTRGASSTDDYSAERIAAVGDTIAALRNRYRRARVVAIGEAGGAIVVANLAGLRPGLVDGIVLVSCPCALPEWRKYRAGLEPSEARWKEKLVSLDPLQTAGGIQPGLRAAILIGGADTRVPARFSRSYAEALSLRGIATDFRIIPDRTAPVLDDPQVIEAARRLAAALPRRN
ncbi:MULTISPECIES: S9 family peptidase [unclassified Sphingomonas]|uniref:alpha/beta hydrolase family protein n=1 Tax=unclassified Sphingomonas TaxID=196159 RepID=UPI002150EFA3|nr:MULTISPECIES: NDRG family protein [unclassified Sphingomonas]MCR5872662.1 NDRG family protein [Sphingomonas sp. J344]UUX99054.1 NDRG family protein [Sphingomonas sp. J315]